MKIVVLGQTVSIADPYLLVSDSEGCYEVEFDFDESWNGYQKTAAFECETNSYLVLLTSNKCLIPNEVVSASGYIRIGVLGTRTEGTDTIKRPTVWSEKLWVDIGCVASGTPAPPSPSVYAQILTALFELGDSVDNLQSTKVDKVEGKGLSTNDYDNTEKQKVTDAYADKHTHGNKGVLDGITSALVSAWNTAYAWVTSNGQNILSHIADTTIHVTSGDKTAWNGKSTVTASASGAATDTVQYITIDGVEKKLAGSGGGGDVDYFEVVNGQLNIVYETEGDE